MSGDRLRSPEDIGATGAAWVTELELAALVEIAKQARVVIKEVETDLPQKCLICAMHDEEHVEGCPVPDLRSALARLDSGEGK